MSDTLKSIGVILIVFSLLFGIIHIMQIDQDDYDTIKKLSSYMNDPLKSLERDIRLSIAKTDIMVTIIFSIFAVLIGVFFIALGEIIELLKNLQPPKTAAVINNPPPKTETT
ncbi:MAG: hypothetical protein ACM3MK_06970 [Chitinophagales bacterium]